MWLQLTLIVILYAVYLHLIKGGENDKNRRIYINIITVVLILQSGLRNFAVGSDTFAYYLKFNDIKEYSYNQIWHIFYDVYVLGRGKDAGFILLTKIFTSICPFFQVYLFVIASCFFLLLRILLKKYLTSIRQLYLAFVIYQTIFYGFFSITGLRQTIATMSTLYCIKYIKSRQFLPFLLLILFASFIHRSVLIFLPFYFFSIIPHPYIPLLCCYFMLPFMFGKFAYNLAIIMTNTINSYYSYLDYGFTTRGAYGFMFFIILSSIIICIAYIQDNNSIPKWTIHAMTITIILIPLIWVNPSFMRLVQYYSIFLLISIPCAIEKIKILEKFNNVIFYSFLFMLLITIISHNAEYKFFWQYMELGENYIR